MRTLAQVAKPSLLHHLQELPSLTLLDYYQHHGIKYDETEAPIHIAYMRRIEVIFAERGLPSPTLDKLCEKKIAEQEALLAAGDANGHFIEPV